MEKKTGNLFVKQYIIDVRKALKLIEDDIKTILSVSLPEEQDVEGFAEMIEQYKFAHSIVSCLLKQVLDFRRKHKEKFNSYGD